MTQRYFVRPNGSYLGAFDGPGDVNTFFDATSGKWRKPRAAEIEVPSAPADASQTWGGNAWSAPPPPVPDPPTGDQLARALIKKGVISQADIDAERA